MLVWSLLGCDRGASEVYIRYICSVNDVSIVWHAIERISEFLWRSSVEVVHVRMKGRQGSNYA